MPFDARQTRRFLNGQETEPLIPTVMPVSMGSTGPGQRLVSLGVEAPPTGGSESRRALGETRVKPGYNTVASAVKHV